MSGSGSGSGSGSTEGSTSSNTVSTLVLGAIIAGVSLCLFVLIVFACRYAKGFFSEEARAKRLARVRAKREKAEKKMLLEEKKRRKRNEGKEQLDQNLVEAELKRRQEIIGESERHAAPVDVASRDEESKVPWYRRLSTPGGVVNIHDEDLRVLVLDETGMSPTRRPTTSNDVFVPLPPKRVPIHRDYVPPPWLPPAPAPATPVAVEVVEVEQRPVVIAPQQEPSLPFAAQARLTTLAAAPAQPLSQARRQHCRLSSF